MADSLPVCDVLCEATEYLSKLGSNLKVRTDNLRERKIRKNLLKNTHAVQKAANKVLLICELSKKSLENVETGVKHLLSQVAASQSAGTETSRRLSDSKVPYEYFEYASKQLKIRKKISLAHYTSVKVVAKAMPPSMLEKYPVYIDCKLFRRNTKKYQKTTLSVDVKNTNSDNSSINTSVNISESNDVERLSKKPSNICEVNVSPKRDLKQNKESQVVHEFESIKVTNENSNNQLDKLDKASPKSCNNTSVNIESSIDMCDDKQHRDIINKRSDVKSANENKNSKTAKKRKFSHTKTFSDNSESENGEEKEKHEENNKSMNTNGDTTKLSLDSSSEVTCSNNVSTKEKSTDLDKKSDDATNEKDKTEISAESAQRSNFFLKCININKLLEAPKEDECIIINDDNEDSVSKQSPNKNIGKTKGEIKNKPKRKSINNQDLAEERSREQKRKEVKSFKPKEFSISLEKLPKFSSEFLKTHKVNKIIKGKSVIFAIESCSEKPIAECNSEKSHLQEVVEKKSHKIANTQVSDLGKNQINSTEHSDSDTENYVIDRDLLQVTESVKKALLDDSDSDTNNVLETSCSHHREFNKNVEKTSTKIKNTNESLEKQQNILGDGNETCKDNAQAQHDKNVRNLETSKSPSQVKSLLLNNSSDDDLTIIKTTDCMANQKSPSSNVLKKLPASQKRRAHTDEKSLRSSKDSGQITSSLSKNSSKSKSISQNIEVDQEIIKSSLLNDSSNDSFTSQNGDKKYKDASPKPNDPDRIKSLVLDDSSCDSLTSPKKEGSRENTSSRGSVDPEKVKSSLLNDSKASSGSQKKGNKTSPKQLDKEQELIKSSLLNDPDSPLKSQERKSSEKNPPCKSKRKLIMDNIRAKKMLLTYSSSSDTEDEQLKSALKEIKDYLLEETSGDNNKHRMEHNSASSSDKDMDLLLRKETNKSRKKKHSQEDTKSRKERKVKRSKSDEENSKSFTRKVRFML